MIVNTKAIVFSTIKYGESDLIVKCYTQSSGLKTYLLRRILKSKKGKLKVSYFQPLTLIEIEANHKDKGTLESIREVKLSFLYKSLHTNILKSTLVIFMAEILSNSITQEEEDSTLFQFLENAFIWLDSNSEIANFHILFLLKLSKYLGFFPDSSSTNKPYFNLVEGNFQNFNTGKFCETGSVVVNLKEFFGIDFDAISQIKLKKNQRSNVLNLMLQYYQLHLHGFKKPKSLLVLNQLFE